MDSTTLDYALMAGEAYFYKRSSDTQRTRRVSVPALPCAHGRDACGSPLSLCQRSRLHANSVATGKWLHRSDSAIRRVSDLDLCTSQNYRGQDGLSTRVTGQEWFGEPMDRASSTASAGVAA